MADCIEDSRSFQFMFVQIKRIFCVGKFRYCYRDFPSLRQMVAFRSAMRMTRRRTWAAIMLRQRLRTRSKFSVAEL